MKTKGNKIEVIACVEANMLVQLDIRRDNTVEGVVTNSVDAVQKWAEIDRDRYNVASSMLDSGTAILLERDRVAVLLLDEPYRQGVFFEIPKSAFYSTNPEVIDGSYKNLLMHNICNAYLVDKNILDYTSLRLPVENKPSGWSEDAMPKPVETDPLVKAATEGANHTATMNGVDEEGNLSMSIDGGIFNGGCTSAIFMAEQDSIAYITTQMLDRKVSYIQNKNVGDLVIDCDKRIPYKYAPVKFGEKIGYMICDQYEDLPASGDWEAFKSIEANGYYKFYTMTSGPLVFYPDVLADVMSSNLSLCPDVQLGTKAVIVCKGIANMFSTDENKEKKEKIVKVFADFFADSNFFRIMHVSWKTGLITAVTPTYNQVLLYAALKQGTPRISSYQSFIPIKGTLGLMIVGMNKQDYNSLCLKLSSTERTL